MLQEEPPFSQMVRRVSENRLPPQTLTHLDADSETPAFEETQFRNNWGAENAPRAGAGKVRCHTHGRNFHLVSAVVGIDLVQTCRVTGALVKLQPNHDATDALC